MNFLCICISTLLLLTVSVTSAQNVKLFEVTPKSPNVAGFEKFKEIPVGLGTGTLDLQIPLYDIKIGNLTIPLSLKYNNNGLKVDEIPSWVGLGWNLWTGGYIVMRRNGIYDFDTQKGMFPHGKYSLDRYFANQMGAQEKFYYMEDIIAGNIDSEYDEYNYNFSNQSGSFIFLNESSARTNPRSDIRISRTASGFKIIDEQGNTFFFEAFESNDVVNPISVSSDSQGGGAYYVTKIITADKKIANFTYKSYALQYSKSTDFVTYSDAIDCGPQNSIGQNVALTRITYMLPERIDFPLGHIKFDYSVRPREDLRKIDPNSTVPYLTGFSVSNGIGKIYEYQFNMGYFDSGSRLRLNGISQIGTGQSSKKWNFEYYGSNDGFPDFFSKSKDHWGYYNGAYSGNNIPKADYTSLITNSSRAMGFLTPSAERTSNFKFARMGMLKTVEYPTGGKSEFEYEQNQFLFQNYNNAVFSPWMLPNNTSTQYTKNIAGTEVKDGTTVTGSFTIPPGGGYYRFSSYRILSPDYLYSHPEVRFTGTNSNSINTLNQITNKCDFPARQCISDEVIFLGAGTYHYTVTGSYYEPGTGGIYYLYAGFNIAGKEDNITTNIYPVGGGRVFRITTRSDANALPLIKKYSYNDSLHNVSIKNIPNYITVTNSVSDRLPPYGSAIGCASCGFLYTVNEENVQPVAGATIEYGLVTEYNDALGILGKVEKKLNFSENIGGNYTMPYVAPANTSWRAGTLNAEKIYEEMQSIPKQENKYSYYANYSGSHINGLKVAYDVYCPVNLLQNTYRTALVTFISEDYKPLSSIKKLNETGVSVVQNQMQEYNSARHQSPVVTYQDNSDGTRISNLVKYVFDYDNLTIANDNAAMGLKQLKNANINVPVEELTVRKINNVDYITAGTLRTYKVNQTVPDEIYVLALSNPIPLTEFIRTSVNGSGLFVKDTRYRSELKFDIYDSNSNILEQHRRDGMKTVYLWSYSNQYPVAEVQNIDYASFSNVLGIGNITAFTNLPNPDKNSIEQFLAPLKSVFPNATIKSYSHIPLIGMNSKTDSRGQTEYYDYNGSGRLMAVRDHQGHLIKTFCYNYKGDPVDCNLSTALDMLTLRLRSLTGSSNLSYATVRHRVTGEIISTSKFPDNTTETARLNVPIADLLSGNLLLKFSSMAYRPMFPDYRPAVNYQYQLGPVGPLWKISNGTSGNTAKMLEVPMEAGWLLPGQDYTITMDDESPSVVSPVSEFYTSSDFEQISSSFTLSGGRVSGSLNLRILSQPVLGYGGFVYVGAFTNDAYMPAANRSFISGNWLCEVRYGASPRLHIKWNGSGSPLWSTGNPVFLNINYNK
ncbi:MULTISPECIES: hypothetical protein [unclassified Sphingobacterium]|uniref:hypothetical protein n=1 Tax=unclassified Sphingobacterium TaxID=2609468 RepID=UPI0025D7A815|nr:MULTISPECIES: hypothetical protein [unclassified Sphingobacterium]